MITADQLKDVKERTEALYRYLNIESKLVEVEEEELRTQAPGFWGRRQERGGTDEEGEGHPQVD